jgi:hypothetical protein
VDIHNGVALGKLTLNYTPQNPDDAVRLQDLSALTGDGNPVFITNVTPTSSGIVAAKQYQAGVVPVNAVMTSCITDTANVRIHFLAEGGPSTYSPAITVDGSAADSISEVVGDKRVFEGYRDIVVGASGNFTVVSSTGASATVTITLATEGPVVQSVVIGALPGTQTELKQGDVVPVTGVVANDATAMIVKNVGVAASGSLSLGASDSGGAGFKTFSGTATVSNRSGVLAVRVSATNFLGTEGAAVDSSNTATLNQTFPTVPAIAVTYPGGQSALKGSESATVVSTITNADTVLYEFSNGTVNNPTTIFPSKTATRTSGTYVTSNNYTITATKASNNATTVRNGSVKIADTAPTAAVTIIGNPSRLRSSAAGEDYIVQIAPTQVLSGAPTMEASIGTWQGSWTSSGNNWRRTLRITDADAKGAGTFNTLSMTNEALVAGTVITGGSGYTVGGIVFREITFPAFARFAAIGSAVLDINKTDARYSGAEDPLTLRNDTNDVVASYTIVDASGLYDPVGTHLFISDAAFAGSNTSGTLKLDFEEVV